MEVWVIDRYGEVLITSTGFPPDIDGMADYKAALVSETGAGEWIGRRSTGEKLYAVTAMLPFTEDSGNNGAVRYMVSLDDLDRQLLKITTVLILSCLGAVVLVTVSGLFFVSSIVSPVKKINESAKLLAEGDFSAKIDSRIYDDEIGELCATFNKMAEAIGEADRTKNEFISTVSHELRTPLTTIKGWGETLLDLSENSDEISVKGLSAIINEADRLSVLVEELLDFSRMESGRLELKPKKIDVLAELDETVFVFRDRAMREGIELKYEAPDIPAVMHADANRIKQVFVNILDNALKYTKKDGKVTVDAEIVEKMLKIIVEDSGCGISKPDLPHIKEKFFKSNLSVKGSGIGLAVADEIIKLHDGEINIDSEIGKGTMVEILLPLL